MEKLRVLHVMSSAIVDQTATILTIHFSKFINELHMKAFPHVLAEGAFSGASARLHTRQGRRPLWQRAVGGADAVLSSQSQHTPSTHTSHAPLDPHTSSVGSLPTRSSERLREKFTARRAVESRRGSPL